MIAVHRIACDTKRDGRPRGVDTPLAPAYRLPLTRPGPGHRLAGGIPNGPGGWRGACALVGGDDDALPAARLEHVVHQVCHMMVCVTVRC